MWGALNMENQLRRCLAGAGGGEGGEENLKVKLGDSVGAEW